MRHGGAGTYAPSAAAWRHSTRDGASGPEHGSILGSMGTRGSRSVELGFKEPTALRNRHLKQGGRLSKKLHETKKPEGVPWRCTTSFDHGAGRPDWYRTNTPPPKILSRLPLALTGCPRIGRTGKLLILVQPEASSLCGVRQASAHLPSAVLGGATLRVRSASPSWPGPPTPARICPANRR